MTNAEIARRASVIAIEAVEQGRSLCDAVWTVSEDAVFVHLTDGSFLSIDDHAYIAEAAR